jgi:hypothetical protein
MSNHEPGYKAVLIREETKRRLQDFRRSLPDRDMYQERRLATAALEHCLATEEGRQAILQHARQIVILDLETERQRDNETTRQRDDETTRRRDNETHNPIPSS